MIVVILVALASGLSGYLTSWYIWEQNATNRRVSGAVHFLANNQFKSKLNLTREGTVADASTTYWLLSDNLLASKALWQYNASVSSRIWNAMVSYGYTTNQLHEVLFGSKIPIPPHRSNQYLVKSTPEYTIRVEIHNGTIFDDYQQYSDLLVYTALDSEWLGNHSAALGNFSVAAQMWDGRGINDKAFSDNQSSTYNQYQTYKLALLIYASKILNISLPKKADLQARMWSMQRDDGGLWTGYNGNLQPSSTDANTETTALAILAGV